jgi:hypothetical protein
VHSKFAASPDFPAAALATKPRCRMEGKPSVSSDVSAAAADRWREMQAIYNIGVIPAARINNPQNAPLFLLTLIEAFDGIRQ